MEVPRDTMTAHFSVNAEGKDRQAVNQAFMKKFNQFNKISQNSKFKAELMERNASPRYQYTNGKRTQTGWEEHAYFKVESKDFEALNRLIADSINIAVLESSSFSVSKEKREETVDQLSKAVILRFKDRAQNLAQTLGFSSYKIVKLNLGHIGNRQVGGDFAHAKMLRAIPAAEMAAGIEDGIPASPGSEEISLTVSGSVQM
ncbi:Predicted periplasmic/secreted protein [Mycobacteroides abscessus subsp. massiliense]|nr:Predicted periplasmic/secreted protein [Mycobacteroides abscessus subsp. massiliense]